MELLTGLILPLAFWTFQGFCQEENSCESLDSKCFRVAALIPARAGKFDSVWVSTDGEAISQEAGKHGARVHWRAPETATDNASTVSAVEDFLLERRGFDVVAVVQCTSPFLQKRFLHNAMDVMLKTDSDCVFSVTRSFQLRWTSQNDTFASPINFNPKMRPRRQDWKGELVENGMFYIVKSALVLQDKVLQNDRCKTVEIPKEYSLEIDTETDLLLARTLLPLLQDSNSSL